MAYNSNDDSVVTNAGGDAEAARLRPEVSAGDPPKAAAAEAPITSATPQSAAWARFASCRWKQPAENGNAAYCTHREVKPYAGTTGFDPDAWCPDCRYYKLRRSPKKRPPADEYTY